MTMKQNEIIKLQDRWLDSQIEFFQKGISKGENVESPFGSFFKRDDFRGLKVKAPLILKNVRYKDLSFDCSNFNKILLINSRLENISFVQANAVILSNNSNIEGCNFFASTLRTSGSTGNSLWNKCIFDSVDLKGCIFQAGQFCECSFEGSKADKVEFGRSVFRNCKFNMKVKKCFFRGLFDNCDLSMIEFDDCAFYGVKFVNCIFSDGVIFFDRWEESNKCIESDYRKAAISNTAKEKLGLLIKVWSQLKGIIVQQLVSRSDLKKLYGQQVGEEIIEYISKYA